MTKTTTKRIGSPILRSCGIFLLLASSFSATTDGFVLDRSRPTTTSSGGVAKRRFADRYDEIGTTASNDASGPRVPFGRGGVGTRRLFSSAAGGGGSRRRSPGAAAAVEARRRTMLSRTGPHFKLDRMSGKIEFGATANLVTQLEQERRGGGGGGGNSDDIATWLRDGRGLALSIWDEKLMKDMGNSVYRLQIMTLQFVTIKLSPWVDVEMKTVDNGGVPVFRLQSVSFEPNVELLPGMRVTAESLGIVIEVAGELRPSPDGNGVRGCISFQTAGKLPPPMRLAPEAVLRAASDAINRTVVNFAIRSFERGARTKYQQFQRQRKQLQQEQKQQQQQKKEQIL